MSLNTSFVLQMGLFSAQPLVDPIGHFHYNSLPMDVARIIFQYLKAELPIVALVSKMWRALADDKVFREMIRPVQAFGSKEWKDYIGVDAGEELKLPRCAYGDLEREGGLLTYIPVKVIVAKAGGIIKEVPLNNLEAIGHFVKKPITDLETGYVQKTRNAILFEKENSRNRTGSG